MWTFQATQNWKLKVFGKLLSSLLITLKISWLQAKQATSTGVLAQFITHYRSRISGGQNYGVLQKYKNSRKFERRRFNWDNARSFEGNNEFELTLE